MMQMNIIADVASILSLVFSLISLCIAGKALYVVNKTTKNNIKKDSQIAIGTGIRQKKK